MGAATQSRLGARGIAVACLIGVLIAACDRPGAERPARNVAELRRNLAYAPGVELFAPPDIDLSAAAALLAARDGRELRTSTLGEPGKADFARIVVGTFDEPEIARLMDRVVPERDVEGRRSFQGAPLNGASDALVASFRDPERPGLPLLLVAAGSEASLTELARDLRFPARPGARVWIDGVLGFEVSLSLEGAPRPSSLRELGQARRGLVRVADGGDALREGVDARRARDVRQGSAQDYISVVRAVRARLARELGVDTSSVPFTVELYREPAHALALTGGVELAASTSPGAPACVLLTPDLSNDAGALAAREMLFAVLGPPAEAWLEEGAAVDAVDQWWGVRLEREEGARGRLLPSLAEIVDPASIDRISVHVLVPARALLHRHLRQTRGEEWVRSLWRGEVELELDAELETAFRSFANPLELAQKSDLRNLRRMNSFLGGVAIDTSFKAGGTLLDEQLAAELARAVAAGARAVSFTSVYYAQVSEPAFGGGALSAGRESLEGDAAIAFAVLQARAAGMEFVALAPRLLISDAAGYASRRRRQSVADWEDFFDAFDAHLAHYAIVAELSGCDLLCIGTEELESFGEGKQTEGLVEYQKQRWSASIALARSLFGGALTYAARTPREVELVPFWEELDAVGATFFPDLSAPGRGRVNSRAATERMRAELQALVEFATAIGRPALVMETGFRSTRSAGLDPVLGAGPVDAAEQERLYSCLAGALKTVRRDTKGPAGLFLWRWESSGAGGGPLDRGFAPRQKPAESIVRGLFGVE